LTLFFRLAPASWQKVSEASKRERGQGKGLGQRHYEPHHRHIVCVTMALAVSSTPPSARTVAFGTASREVREKAMTRVDGGSCDDALPLLMVEPENQPFKTTVLVVFRQRLVANWIGECLREAW
jgi:hypothetical protein